MAERGTNYGEKKITVKKVHPRLEHLREKKEDRKASVSPERKARTKKPSSEGPETEREDGVLKNFMGKE